MQIADLITLRLFFEMRRDLFEIIVLVIGLSLAVGTFKKVALLSLYFDSEDGRLLMGMVVGPETLDELLIKFLTCSIPVGNPVVRVVHFLEVVVALVVVVLGIG